MGRTPLHVAAASGNVPIVRLLLGAEGKQAKRELERMLRTGEPGVVVEEDEQLGALLTVDNYGHTPLSLLLSLRASSTRAYDGAEVLPTGVQTVTTSGGWKLDVPPLLKRGLDELAGGTFSPKLCDIEQRDAANFTVEEFERDFLLVQRPLLLRGAITTPHRGSAGAESTANSRSKLRVYHMQRIMPVRSRACLSIAL